MNVQECGREVAASYGPAICCMGFGLDYSKPVEKSEKTSVAPRRSPAPVKSSSVNSPAPSGEPDRKPVVKKENASSDGEKRGASRAAGTLTPDAGKNEVISRSPIRHGKSPLPPKDEKME